MLVFCNSFLGLQSCNLVLLLLLFRYFQFTSFVLCLLLGSGAVMIVLGGVMLIYTISNYDEVDVGT